MKVLIYGAGVIGQIFGGRLARAGHDVSVLARGERARSLADNGITLHQDGESFHVSPLVLTVVPPESHYDVVLVTVRRDQVAEVVPAVARVAAERIVFTLNQFADLEELRARTGQDRTLFGFPGVAGYHSAEATVTYLEIPQQRTTIERRGGREQMVVDLFRSAGLPVEVSADMFGWLATHAVFVAAVGSAVLAAGGDSAALAADRARVAEMVAAVGEGFRALSRLHITVTPTPLRMIFTVVPRFIAVPYWQKQLRGPTGTVGIAPHMRATRFTELATLVADIRRLLAAQGPTPRLEKLFDLPAAAPPPAITDSQKEE
jgi:2-dehydropantoate 2-reductase